MPRLPAPLPDALGWTVFTRAEALRAGVTTDRLRRSDLETLRRGLYTRRGVPIGEMSIAAALCRADPDAVVVGPSAARMLGLPLPRSMEAWTMNRPVHVSVPGGRRGSDRVVRWRDLRLQPEEVLRLGFRQGPATDPSEDRPVSPLRLGARARTWRDLAPLLPHWRLVSIGDHLVRRPRPHQEDGRDQPWCTVDELRRACAGPNARLLRSALEDVRVGADSPMETMLRLAFRDAGLPTPLINRPLIGPDGAELHEPDFQWPQFQVCAEYDGVTHGDPAQVQRDIRRGRRVRSAGWSEVRLSHKDTDRRCSEAVRIVRAELISRGWRP